MRSQIIKACLLLLILSLSSCAKTADKRIVTEIPPETREDRVKMEWDGYMNLVRGGSDFSVETILRLAERYMEAEETEFEKEMEEYEKAMALYTKGVVRKRPREPRHDLSSFIDNLNIVAGRYRYGKGADEVRYLLGYVLHEQGDIERASSIFEELVRDFPESRHYKEVCFRLGEIYYETGKPEKAVTVYKKVLEDAKSVFYDKALYKLGWTYYRIEDFTEGANCFVSLLERADALKGSLREEGTSSLIVGLSHFEDAEEVIRYIRSLSGKEYFPAVVIRLGELYFEETRYNHALDIYEFALENIPDHPEIPFILDRMAFIHERSGDKMKELETRWKLVTGFNASAPWYLKNRPLKSGELDEMIKKNLSDTTTSFHVRGKKEGRLSDLERAVEGYKLLLSLYPGLNTSRTTLLLAEALFESKSYDEAAMEYEKAALLHPAGKERGDIVYSSLLSVQMRFYDGEEKKSDILNYADRLFNTYRTDLAQSDKFIKTALDLSEMHIKAGNYARARDILKDLTGTPNEVEAKNKIAELYLAEGDLISAEGIYAGLPGERGREPLAQVRFQMAENLLAQGKQVDAVSKYASVIETSPGSKIAEAALIKVGKIYLEGNDFDNIITSAGLLVKDFSRRDAAVTLLVDGGRRFEGPEPLKAAALYEKASSIIDDDRDRQRLMLASAILYYDHASYSEAEAVLQKYLNEKRLPLTDKADAGFMLGKIKWNSGDRKDGRRFLKIVSELQGKIDDRLVAEARLILTTEDRERYLGFRLSHPFKKTFQKKTEMLEEILSRYSDIIKIADQELLPEIYFQIGFILEDFRDSILNAERPKDLTEEEAKEYSFLLEEKAYPYEEQAVKAYEKTHEICSKHGIRNDWNLRSLDRLEYLRPAIYKKEDSPKPKEDGRE